MKMMMKKKKEEDEDEEEVPRSFSSLPLSLSNVKPTDFLLHH